MNPRPQILSELSHFIRLQFRNRIRSLVIGNIALLSEQVELADESCVGADRELQRMNDAIVVIGAIRAVAGCGKRGGR